MDDLISRQQAIDALENSSKPYVWQGAEIVRNLPSAQPDLQSTCNQLATDTISRQAAIDALQKCRKHCIDPFDSYHIDIQDAENQLSKVPTIQPEKAQLSQEGTTFDTISRQQVLGEIKAVYEWHDTVTMERLIEHINNLPTIQTVATDTNVGATISKFIDGLEEIFADLRERHVDDSVCGLCEYEGAYMGQSGDWCNECPGFDRDDCFKLSDETRKKWTDEIIKALPTVQSEPQEGRWVDGRCSKCGGQAPFWVMASTYYESDFCPHCGAKMKGETT